MRCDKGRPPLPLGRFADYKNFDDLKGRIAIAEGLTDLDEIAARFNVYMCDTCNPHLPEVGK